MKIKQTVLLILLVVTLATSLNAQRDENALYKVATEQAKNHQYKESITNFKTLLNKNPERTDILVYIANIYAWDNKYDSAKIYINKALQKNKQNNDAYATLLNILLWNKEYENLLTTANAAESYAYNNKYDLFFKRLLAYKGLGKYDDALLLLNKAENSAFLDSAKIKNIEQEILLLSKNKTFGLTYALDFFENNAPQHLASLEYSWKLHKQTLCFRGNYASKFQKQGLQMELDYYKTFKKGYTYFNYGYALNNNLFPNHRLGAEYYFPIVKSLEGSIGGRFLNFSKVNVYIATGSLTKYAGNNMFSLRPFYTFKSTSDRQALTLIADYRLYGKNIFYYWGLELGYGNSPDDRLIIQSSDNFRLQSYKAKIERNFMVCKTSNIKIAAGYTYEEFYTNKFRNRYSIELQYKFRIK